MTTSRLAATRRAWAPIWAPSGKVALLPVATSASTQDEGSLPGPASPGLPLDGYGTSLFLPLESSRRPPFPAPPGNPVPSLITPSRPTFLPTYLPLLLHFYLYLAVNLPLISSSPPCLPPLLLCRWPTRTCTCTSCPLWGEPRVSQRSENVLHGKGGGCLNRAICRAAALVPKQSDLPCRWCGDDITLFSMPNQRHGEAICGHPDLGLSGLRELTNTHSTLIHVQVWASLLWKLHRSCRPRSSCWVRAAWAV